MIADLRLGRWQDVLADVECDAFVSDPQYSDRVHDGHNALENRESLPYEPMDKAKIVEVVEHWSPRTRGWMVIMTSHDLIPAWEDSLRSAGRYVFAPLPVIDRGSRVRMQGDGPSSWTVWMIVARPKTKAMSRWGTLPGVYERYSGDERSPRRGGKPLGVMCDIVGDYSRPGDIVCDPYAGAATTLLAARMKGRRSVGAEVDPEAYAEAMARLDSSYMVDMFDQLELQGRIAKPAPKKDPGKEKGRHQGPFPHFNGPVYEPPIDHGRLTKQLDRVREMMRDGQWRTLSEIEKITRDPPASISAQLRHLRKKRFGSWIVDKQRRGANSGLWEYRLREGNCHERP